MVFLGTKTDDTTKSYLICCIEEVFCLICGRNRLELSIDAIWDRDEAVQVVIKPRNLPRTLAKIKLDSMPVSCTNIKIRKLSHGLGP